MELEHCKKPGHDYTFTTGNYQIKTTSSREYNIVMGKVLPGEQDMQHDRRIPKLEHLEKLETSKKANLKLVEIIMLVLYTGPMVHLPRMPYLLFL